MVITLLSKVTAALRASNRPITVAPVFAVIASVCAMAVPTKSVSVPSVAALPTCQKTLQEAKSSVNATLLLDAVVNAVPIRKMNTASGSPTAFSVSVPVNCAELEKQYTPGVRVSPPRSWPVRSSSQAWAASAA